jgi:hypothetical protein
MPGPATIFYTCRTTILALENASDIAAKVESACGMTTILPSAHWRNTFQFMRLNPVFWCCLLAVQFLLLAVSSQLILFAEHNGPLLDMCRDGYGCHEVPGSIRWLVLLGRPNSVDSWKLLMVAAFVVPGFFAQASWIAAARYAANIRHTALAGWQAFLHGCLALPRAGLLGVLPMRFLAMFADWNSTPLIKMEWRWRIMILGRFCHFTMLALIAKGIPSTQIPQEASAYVKKHHMELLDSFGTYNIIFSVCIGAALLFVGGLLLLDGPFNDEQITLIVSVALLLCIPMIFARLLMIAHFSRVIAGHVATP